MNNPEIGSLDLEAKKEAVVKTIEKILLSGKKADEKMIIAVVQSYIMARLLAEGVVSNEVEYSNSGHSARFRKMWDQVETDGVAFGINENDRMRTEGVGNRLEEIYRLFTSTDATPTE